MKRKIICLLVAILSLAVLLPSCNNDVEEETTTEAVCEAHADVDANQRCDNCGTPVLTIVKDVPKDEEEIATILAEIPADATITAIYTNTVNTENDVISVTEPVSSEITEKWFDGEGVFEIPEAIADGIYVIEYTRTNMQNVVIPFGDLLAGEEYEIFDEENNTVEVERPKSYTDVTLVYNAELGKYVYSHIYEYGISENRDEYCAVRPVIDVYFDEFFGDAYITTTVGFAVVTATVEYEAPEVDSSEEESTADEAETGDDGSVDDIVNALIPVTTYKTDYYTLNGSKFVEDVYDGGLFDVLAYDVECDTYDDDVSYVTVEGTVYVIKDNEVIYSEKENTFIARPCFDFINEEKNYGYIQDGSTVLVYNLGGEKWIDCIYSYDVSANSYNVFYLANGNILVQTETLLPDEAVNYDYTDGDYKYDVDYFVVNIAEDKVEEIEFGYYINYVDVADREIYAEDVKNIVNVNKIENKNIIVSDNIVLAVDDALKIIGDVDATHPDSRIYYFRPIAENVFMADIEYGEGSYVTKLFNEKGEEIAILPNGAIVFESYILVDDTVYDMTMKELYVCENGDGVSEEILYYGCYENYVLILRTETVEGVDVANVYYFNPSMEAPVKITSYEETFTEIPADPEETVAEGEEAEPETYLSKVESKNILSTGENYFVIIHTVYEYDENGICIDETVDYTLYNEENKAVYNGESRVADVIEGDGVFTVILEDGTVLKG